MLEFKYVPTLRLREQERKAFCATAISNKMVPLVEIMTEKPRSNSKNDSIHTFITEFGNINTSVMLDFPMYLTFHNNTSSNVIQFMGRLKANPSLRMQLYTDPRLLNLENLIPVITYNPTTPYSLGSIVQEERTLREHYKTIAFRVFPQSLSQTINDVVGCARNGDILIFDIDEDSPHSTVIRSHYSLIYSVQPNVRKVLLRSAIPRSLTNTGLVNGQIVTQADNCLLTDYRQLGFDAFGDYIGVKKDEWTDGGRISPGYIMYSWSQNAYYGFNGVINQPITFETMIVPSIISSPVWNQLQTTHHSNCFGCSTINQISLRQKSGKAQPEWKGFAVGHYLYTMEEFL